MKENLYLSKEYTRCLRGLFAILVVAHHLYQYSGLLKRTFIGEILTISGALSVAVFFFFSGYGLMLSSNKERYIQCFLRTRFFPLYCFYIVIVVLYSLWTLILGGTISLKQIAQSFLFGGTIVTNGWYLQATFVFYLLYWLIFSVFKSPKMQICLFGIAICFYFVFCFLLGLNIWWYQSVFSMVLGMVYCYQKKKIDALLGKCAWLILILTSALFIIFVMLSSVTALVSVVYSLFFVCAVICFSYVSCDTPIINNSFFSLCGKYSLEIYVTHGFFLRLIRLHIIESKLLYVLVVIVGTVIMSAIMKKVYTKTFAFISTTKQRNPI